VTVDLLCMGEPMLEFNQQPPAADGTQHYLEGFGGDTSNAAIAAARQGARVGMITAVGQDAPGDRFIDLWEREGVDTTCVQRTDRYQTSISLPTTPRATTSCTIEPGRPPRCFHRRMCRSRRSPGRKSCMCPA
jgi:2-dehydro-3-deoxygluconokinase